MPRIDAVTGCTVMTPGEFWQHEAQQEGQGRSGLELQAEFYADLEADNEREAARLRQPAEALRKLLAVRRWWNKGMEPSERLPYPQAVLAVTQVEYHASFSSGPSVSMVLRVRTARGDGVMTVDESSTPDTRLDPGDYDLNLTWTRDRKPRAQQKH